MNLNEIFARIDGDALRRDLDALCDCGGRLAGSESERKAVAWLTDRLATIGHGKPTAYRVPYDGWRSGAATLESGDGTRHPVQPLVGSPAAPRGLIAEILDLGRGAQADFDAAAERIDGRIVMVRHEYMFDPGHLHRIRKYQTAVECGAVGFIVANPWPESGRVSGGLGFGERAPIPAVGIGADLADQLAQTAPEAQPVRLVLTSSSAPETAESLILDLPGRTGEWVVVSAHLDGHAVAESAIDNASGVVVALAVAEALEPVMSENQRGLRVCMFNIEEWGLLASRSYVNGLSEAERESIAVNINLDSIAGNDRLTCMISGFTRLRSLTTEACEAARVDADHYVPLVRNSDHYYFAEAGIPAMRVVAGFGDVETNLRYVLTEGDTRNLITTSQLEHAARFAVALTLRAAQAPSRMVAGWRTID